MRKIRNYKYLVLSAGLVVSVLSSCHKEVENDRVQGPHIAFSASAFFENPTFDSRTEYGGEVISVGSERYERIDWVKDYDRIRVLCDNAEHGPIADYTVTTEPSASSQLSSVAGVSPLDGQGLLWGNGVHTFYALYPAPGMSSNYAFTDRTVSSGQAHIESVAQGAARITGIIPSVQEVFQVGASEYKANMNYAYMYAAVRSTENAGPVELLFKPLVTAFEFTVKGSSPEGLNLTKIELASEESTLGGNFTADVSLDDAGIPSLSVSTDNTTASLSITLPEGGFQLGDTPVKITFLALPVPQEHLTLRLYFGTNYSVRRSLELRSSDGWLTVPACTKLYVSNVDVPGRIWDYHLGEIDDVVVTGHIGGNGASSFESYRSRVDNPGVREPVDVTYSYSLTGADGSWSASLPEGIVGMTGSSSASTLTYNASFDVGPHSMETAESPRIQSDIVDAARVLRAKAAVNEYDLSKYTVLGEFHDLPRTANSYVISRPGTYRFPIVYGNGIDWFRAPGNGINTRAYSDDWTTERD